MDRPLGIALDCYGTLLTITRPLGATRRAAVHLHGSTVPSPMVADVAMADALVAAGCDPAEAVAIQRDMEAEADSVEMLPGTVEALKLLRDTGVGITIASNLSREYATPIKRLLPGLPAILSFEVGCRKPQPAMFYLIRERLGLPAHAIAMVGDSRTSDHEGATAAGMRAVLLSAEPVSGVETVDDILAAVRHLLRAT